MTSFLADYHIYIIVLLLFSLMAIYLHMQRNLKKQKERFRKTIETIKDREKRHYDLLMFMGNDIYQLSKMSKFSTDTKESSRKKLQTNIFTSANNLRELLKIQTNSIETYKENFVFAQMLEEILVYLSSSFSKRETEVLFDIDPNVPCCFVGDVVHLSRIINNLLEFSIDEISEGEVFMSVTSSAVLDGECTLTITIKNDSATTTKEVIRRLFMLDYKNENEERASIRLYIAHKLTLVIDGTIEVLKNEKGGNTLVLNVPLHIISSPDIVKLDHYKEQFGAQKLLIVSRSLKVGQILKKLFGNLYSNSVTIPKEKLKAFANNLPSFDCILLEYGDIEEIKNALIQKKRENSSFCVIATYNLFSEVDETAYKFVDIYLKRPITADAIEKIIQKLQKNRANQTENTLTDLAKNDSTKALEDAAAVQILKPKREKPARKTTASTTKAYAVNLPKEETTKISEETTTDQSAATFPWQTNEERVETSDEVHEATLRQKAATQKEPSDEHKKKADKGSKKAKTEKKIEFKKRAADLTQENDIEIQKNTTTESSAENEKQESKALSKEETIKAGQKELTDLPETERANTPSMGIHPQKTTLKVHKDPIEETEDIDLDAFSRFKGVRLLIVEDNKVNQRILTSVLIKSGMIIEIVNNGEEALDCLLKQNRAYDIILMDISMPVLDGIRTTQILRQYPIFDAVPIITFTAFTLGNEIERMFAVGANAYITKPLNVQKLYTVFDMFLPKVYREVPLENEVAIEGLDVQTGIFNADQSKALYKETLKEFVAVYGELADLMPIWIREKHYERAKITCRELQNVLIAIGAYEFKELVVKMNKSFLYGEEGFLDDYSIEFSKKLKKLIKTIQHYLSQS